MKASVATGGLDTSTARAASLIERLALRGIVASLRRLRRGRVTFVTPSGDFAFGGVEPGPQATVTVHDPHFYSALAFSGNIGAAESYARGEWSADDLIGLVRVMALNWNVFTGLDGWANWLVRPFHRAAHMLRRNTTRGSRRNIGLHYDLSNDFFATFLDPTLSYSAAIFEHDGMTLEQASVAKIDRICRKLRLSPRDHLLEIGTGWGALAMHAATQYGCRVTTTTISREQYRLAGKRIQTAGLADRVTVLQQDYRALTGQYDKLVSVEMIEAVGAEYFDTFFGQCSDLLTPEGVMVLQAIVVADQRYEQSRRSVDFIRRHIFPGGCIPSVGAICASVGRAADMRLVHLEDISPHYATTLEHWRRSLLENASEVRRLGFGEDFIRMWEFYFSYCAGGFAERIIGDVQMVFAKPLCRLDTILPDRRHLSAERNDVPIGFTGDR